MKLFLSWSGPASKKAALALRDWLPNVIQAIDPWMSAEDIDKGSRWSSVLAKELSTTKAGIVCLTPDNTDSAWLNSESGALSKAVEETMVCPFLFRMKPADLTGPLTQFQMSEANKEDTQKIITTLNKGSEKPLAERKLAEAFEVWWPKLEAKLEAISPDMPAENTRRDSDDMLQEVLSIVRDQSRTAEDILDAVRRLHWKDQLSPNAAYPNLIYLSGLDTGFAPGTNMFNGGIPQDVPTLRTSGGRLYSRRANLEPPGEELEPEIEPAGPLPGDGG